MSYHKFMQCLYTAGAGIIFGNRLLLVLFRESPAQRLRPARSFRSWSELV